LYFDGVDCVCDVIAALDRAVKAALAARAFAAGSWVVGQFESEDRRSCRNSVLQELRQWCPVLGADYFWLADNTANERQSGNGFRTSVPLRRDLSLFAIESERYVS
jgi:hypothetical protein